MLQPASPQRVGFLLIPDFPLLTYAAALEPLRAANSLSGRVLYEWVHIAPGAGPATASCGVSVNVNHPVGANIELDYLFVVAGGNPFRFEDSETFRWLRALAKKGVRVGGISGGPVILARAGLLTGHRCTLHWEHIPALREMFPDLELETSLFEIDGARLTCAGATAALDMMHNVISSEHGEDLGAAVSDWFLQTHVRPGADRQRLSLRQRFGVSDPKLLKALQIMEDQLETPWSRSEIAREAGISIRQLERLSRTHLKTSLTAHYKKVRLGRAQSLLRQTSMSVMEVAIACGFVSASHFSQSYNALFGYPPRLERSPKPDERRSSGLKFQDLVARAATGPVEAGP